MELKNHHIIHLIRSLPKDEVVITKKFISSPYFNTNKNIASIFDEIAKFHPDNFGHRNFNKEFIYRKVYHDKPYKDSNMRWILSEIGHLLEKYFAQKHFEKDVLARDYYLSTEYFGRMEKELVRKSLDSAGKNLANVEEKDFLYFLHKYIYQTNELNYVMVFKSDKKAKDLDFYYRTFLKAIISYINHFIIGIAHDYISAELLLSKYIKNGISKRINDIIKILNFPKISGYLEKDNEDAESLRTLIKILNLFLNLEDDSFYFDAKDYLKKNKQKMSPGEKAGFYSRLISYCRLKIIYSEKEEFYRKELLNLTKLFFEKKYYLDGRISFFSHVLFKLSLDNALELNEFSYAEKFIKKCSEEMSPAHRENAVNYGKAMINFHRNQFDEALFYSSKLSGNFFLTDQKAFRIILFNEKGYYDECETEIKTFKKFLKTNKFLDPLVSEAIENFLYFVPFITKQGNKKNLMSKRKLKENLKDKKRVYFKNWIAKKIERL